MNSEYQPPPPPPSRLSCVQPIHYYEDDYFTINEIPHEKSNADSKYISKINKD